MTDLKNVITDFSKTSAYAVLDDLVRVCGVGSVLSALSEIVAAQQSVQRTRAYCECKKPIEFLYGDIYYCKVCNRPCR